MNGAVIIRCHEQHQQSAFTRTQPTAVCFELAQAVGIVLWIAARVLFVCFAYFLWACHFVILTATSSSRRALQSHPANNHSLNPQSWLSTLLIILLYVLNKDWLEQRVYNDNLGYSDTVYYMTSACWLSEVLILICWGCVEFDETVKEL